MSLLTICQDAAVACGLSEPATIASNNNIQAKQLYLHARKELEFLTNEYDWQELTKEHTFTLATATQTYSLPSDYQRLVHGTMWDRTNRRKSHSPTGPKEWAYLKGHNFVSSLNRNWRIKGDLFEVYETIEDGDSGNTIAVEYISNENVTPSGGGDQAGWSADTDVAKISEHLIYLGVVWRFKSAKQIDGWEESKRSYISERQKLTSHNNDRRGLYANKPTVATAIGIGIPDHGYG